MSDPAGDPASDPVRGVGRAIAGLRRARGLSLSELARRSGVGKATLSQLEAGRRNPTLDTLFALTTAMSVPLSEVLDDGPVLGAAVAARLLEVRRGPRRTVEVYRITLREGPQRSAPHAPGVAETLILTHGSARVGTEAGPVDLEQGDCCTFPGDVPHLYESRAPGTGGILALSYPTTTEGHDMVTA